MKSMKYRNVMPKFSVRMGLIRFTMDGLFTICERNIRSPCFVCNLELRAQWGPSICFGELNGRIRLHRNVFTVRDQRSPEQCHHVRHDFEVWTSLKEYSKVENLLDDLVLYDRLATNMHVHKPA